MTIPMYTGQCNSTLAPNNVITLFDPRNKKLLRRLTADQVSGLTKQFITEIETKVDYIRQCNNPEYKQLISNTNSSQENIDFDAKLSLVGLSEHSNEAVSKILEAEAVRVESELRELIDFELSKNPSLRAPVKNCDHTMQLSYLTDFSFVKRRITKAVNHARLEYEAKNRLIGGNTGIDYCSNESATFVRRKDEKNAEFLKRRNILVKQTGQLINLYDLQSKQAERKFNECYYVIKNLESIAIDRGLVPHMLTLTAPANYHPNPLRGKSSFNQTSGYDSQKYLSKTWAQLRALLSKRGTPFSLESCFGVRTAELHKDGCIHWHILMFIDPTLIDSFQDGLDFYFTSRQADIKEIEGVAGATYVLKYIGKTVDPSKLDRPDLFDELVDQERKDKDLSTIADADRVRAGIRVMGVRQMQYYGIQGSLTLFRTLNKITQDAGSFPESVRTILAECRMHDRSNGNIKISNFLAFKNFLCTHLGSVELIREEGINKHGAKTCRTVGVRFIESATEIFTNDQYEVITCPDNLQEKEEMTTCSLLSLYGKAEAKTKVTVISIYPRKADRLSTDKIARPAASELLKQVKTLNPKRYIQSYVMPNATKEPLKILKQEEICRLMSMT